MAAVSMHSTKTLQLSFSSDFHETKNDVKGQNKDDMKYHVHVLLLCEGYLHILLPWSVLTTSLQY